MPPELELWSRELLQGQVMRLRSLGGSMIPSLREGDLVTVVPAKTCRVGDIVLYNRGDSLIMHRVLAKFADKIITKGDAAARLDPPLNLGDILGRAVSYERQGKKFSLNSLRSRMCGLAYCLTVSWIPGSITLLAALKRLGREKLGLGGPFRNFKAAP